ncbi:MAG: hypothetical protein HHAS10_05770 [Candidatus Altimarinota bacterium]
MLKLIETLRAKPTDRNIRIVRIVFATILLGVIYFGLDKTSWEYPQIPQFALNILYVFPVIGFIRGIFDPGIMRKKLWKWTQVGFGVVMLMLSWFFIETDIASHPAAPSTSISGELSAIDIINSTRSTQPSVVDTDFWLGFFGFWLVLAGLTIASKNITSKNERYGEKVTKIRV